MRTHLITAEDSEGKSHLVEGPTLEYKRLKDLFHQTKTHPIYRRLLLWSSTQGVVLKKIIAAAPAAASATPKKKAPASPEE